MFESFLAIVEPRFVILVEALRAHESEVAHRKLRQAVADAAKIQEQEVTHGVDAPLHENTIGVERDHDFPGVEMFARKCDKFVFFIERAAPAMRASTTS